jgi:hypothetical protein
MTRTALPNRREHLTQKVKIGAHRTLYLSVDHPVTPRELFLRIRGEADAEKVVAYDVLARLVSLALQHGVPMADIGHVFHGTREETAGAVQYDARIKRCDGTLDYVGRHLLVYFARREDLAHVAHVADGPPPTAEDHG